VAWRDFVTRMKVWFCHGNRGTISGGVARFCRIVARFYEASHDFGRRKYFLFKLKPVPELRVTILRPEDCWKGDFIILYSVHVCFNYFIDYAICKLDYE